VKTIAKGPEPASLTTHRQIPQCNYENYAAKNDLRLALVTEQNGLCCYCLGRVRNGPTTVKVEHWRSQTRYPAEQLNYRNLLGACLGGEGQPGRLQHCDTRKGDRNLKWNPADPTHHIESRIRYEFDGSIRADDPTFDAQLDDVLNLNIPLLKNNRKAVYDAVLEWFRSERRRHQGPVPRERLEREWARHDAAGGELDPYSHIAVWLLGQRLTRMAAA
jgi:uncharacterized protein (TIGR02646 family)